MFQVPGFPLSGRCIHPEVTGHDSRRVSPFGYLRISVCLRLPVAFRSWPRPSSAYGALASALCSCLLHFLNPETMSFYFRLLVMSPSLFTFLTGFQEKLISYVQLSRFAWRSRLTPLLASGRTLKTIQRAETTSCLFGFPLLSSRLDRPRMSAPDFSFALLLRKEVIQPHLPIRLPCYDFTPVIDLTLGCWPLSVTPQLSGAINSHGVTGGVYKARERIHRGMLIRDY